VRGKWGGKKKSKRCLETAPTYGENATHIGVVETKRAGKNELHKREMGEGYGKKDN